MTVRLHHPVTGADYDAPPEAVGHLAMSGWVPAEGEAPPECPTCHRVWPAFAEQPPEPAGDQQQADEAPAEQTGASASKGSRRRRTSSEESE